MAAPEHDTVGSIYSHDFMGKDGFLWFVGIIEDVKDPLELGRCRVRAIGYHTLDRDVLKNDQLPWAYSLAPLNNYAAPKPPPNGTFVLGFFLDGSLAQQPVIFGALNGYRHRELMVP